uniref:Uncharacterized protein n=1 Tax=Guillardia theta TaxID=55529 RepID=A0A7S4LZV3_GUITH
MLEVLEEHDMDEEDLKLLRSKGVKKVADFHRISDVKSLQLPPVTEVKLKELLASLNEGSKKENVLSRVRRSWGALMSFLPLYTSEDMTKGASGESEDAKKQEDAEKQEDQVKMMWILLDAYEVCSPQPIPSKRKRGDKGGQPERNEEQEGVRAKRSSNRRSAGTTGGKAQRGTARASRTKTSAKTSLSGRRKVEVAVKEEAVFEMSLRPKRFKKGFYSFKDIENKAWKKGRGNTNE